MEINRRVVRAPVNGKVLQVRVGEAVLQLVSGALWTIPLTPGISGKAGIKRIHVDFESSGTLTWKAVAAGEGKVRIEADVSYTIRSVSSMFVAVYGEWLATYRGVSPLPESSVTTIRRSNMVSSELKLR